MPSLSMGQSAKAVFGDTSLAQRGLKPDRRLGKRLQRVYVYSRHFYEAAERQLRGGAREYSRR